MTGRCVLSVVLLSAMTAAAASRDANVDVQNRSIAPLLSKGRPVLVLYCNRSTRQVGEVATTMAVRLHDVPFTTLVHVDLRGIPSLFHGIAEHAIKRRQEEGVERFRQEFSAAGVPPPSDSADRLILVADANGAPHEAEGLPQGFTESLAVVLDPEGKEVARGFFPREVDRIEHALREASQR